MVLVVVVDVVVNMVLVVGVLLVLEMGFDLL